MHGDTDRGYGSGRGMGGGQRGGGRGRGGDRGEPRGVPLSELDPALTAVSHSVIGCARDVHMALGPGYDREVYLEALKQEMVSQNIAFKALHPLAVNYKGQRVGSTTVDLFIAERFLVRVLAAYGEVESYERTQLRAQLRAADLELGLIINFAGKLLKDGLVRVLNPEKLRAMRGDAPFGGGESEGEESGHWASDQPA